MVLGRPNQVPPFMFDTKLGYAWLIWHGRETLCITAWWNLRQRLKPKTRPQHHITQNVFIASYLSYISDENENRGLRTGIV